MSGDGIGYRGGLGGPTRLVQLREGAADATKRRCKDCAHLEGLVSWWCNNEAARKERGTGIPGIRDCSHWEAPPLSLRARFVVAAAERPWWRFW